MYYTNVRKNEDDTEMKIVGLGLAKQESILLTTADRIIDKASSSPPSTWQERVYNLIDS